MMYIERQIVRRLFGALVEAFPDKTIVVDSDRGYDPDAKRFEAKAAQVDEFVNECDGYDEVHIFVDGPTDGTFDDEGRPVEAHGPWVYLIFGNGNCGWDLITDHVTSLEEALKDVTEFVTTEGAHG